MIAEISYSPFLEDGLHFGFKVDPFKEAHIDDEYFILDAPKPKDVHHEPLVMQQCGRHTVNCLLQNAKFSWKDFETEANLLKKETKALLKPRFARFDPRSFLSNNPHKSFLGLGNYDIQIMERMMLKLGYNFRWINQSCENLEYAIFQKDDVEYEAPNDNFLGLIINVPTESLATGQVSSTKTHFFSIQYLHDKWYNLDSRLPTPQQFISKVHMINWLNNLRNLYGNSKIIVIVVQKY